MPLKCDLHIHTGEDTRHDLDYGARDLIAVAARRGYQVISITNHDRVTYSGELAGFARERGILLIPGVEATVGGKHVLLYGVDGMEEDWGALDVFALRRLRMRGALVVAPHPFYPGYNSPGSLLVRFPYLFDAVEYSHLYVRRVNFNRRAASFARRNALPLLGQSDAHSLRQLDYTYSLVDAEPVRDQVFRAIRGGRLEVASHPARLSTAAAVGVRLFSTFLGSRMPP
jgi:predicted metal-dependent phosphoesterase TrpH